MLIDKATGKILSDADEAAIRARAAAGEPVIRTECDGFYNYVPVEYFMLPEEIQATKDEWAANESLAVDLAYAAAERENAARDKLAAIGLTPADLQAVV